MNFVVNLLLTKTYNTNTFTTKVTKDTKNQCVALPPFVAFVNFVVNPPQTTKVTKDTKV